MVLFFSTLESVLNINSEMAQRLVTNFNTGDLPFFEAYFNALPTAKLEHSNVKNGSVDYTLFIDEASIGEGGYGTIYKNRVRPYVYKTMEDYTRVDNKNSLLYLKTNFKEAIIQALLQSDLTYGKHVCRIYKVYKTGNNFIFQIEPLEIELDKYISKHHTEDHLYETMPRVLLKLVEILNYFYVKYGFNHNDMSTSNVMTVKTGAIAENLKLIDFGKSTVKFGGIEIGTYAKKRNDTIHLYKVIKFYMAEKYRAPFNRIVNLSPETPYAVLLAAFEKINKKGGVRKTRRIRSVRVLK
jgi:serine/threonine protein kinase